MWEWIKAHQTAAVIGGFILVGAVYLVGVALFDQSTEDAARERAAREVTTPALNLTASEERYLKIARGNTDKYFSDEEWLRAAQLVCWDWQGWANGTQPPGALFSALANEDIGGTMHAAQQGAAELCPDSAAAYQQHLESGRSGPYDPDGGFDPKPAEDRDWGPRG